MSYTFDDPDPYWTSDGLLDVIHVPNGGDDYDIEPKLPNSWVEDGARHCVVWDLDSERRYKWDSESGNMIHDTSVF